MTKELSAGVIIYFDGKFLMGRATNTGGRYDIFKGYVEPNERYMTGALRELREESGIELIPTQVNPMGIFEFTKKKDLYLVKYSGKKDLLPPLNKLKCISMVNDEFPEMDKYRWVSLEEIRSKKIKVGKSLAAVLEIIEPIL